LDERDKRLFSKYSDINRIEEMEISDSLIPKINNRNFDFYIN
jgi:sensor domain CHASE-containing protein